MSTLKHISLKLGIPDEHVIKKAEEYHRTYQSKASLKTINDTAQMILCIDLAASRMGCGFDKETAIKLSALKKSMYENNLHNIEKILNLDRPLAISELCVQFSCTVVKDIADSIYKKYKLKNPIVDGSHPQYPVMCVFQACKLKKLKIEKSQCLSVSRLKLHQWKDLETEFDKFVESIGLKADSKKANQKKNGNEFENYLEDYSKSKECEIQTDAKENKEEQKVEDYEVWKKRILEEALEAIKNNSQRIYVNIDNCLTTHNLTA